MLGLMMENGPFRWLPGTYAPVVNPWSWNRLAHVVYVDQPIGTGYSTGPITSNDQDDVARDFAQFWRRFIDTFGLFGSRVYFSGESYAGMYVPYIAGHMLDLRDAGELDYFDVRGALLYDALITNTRVQSEVPAVRFMERTAVLHPFNESFTAHIAAESERCGFTEYLDKYLTYPPTLRPQPDYVPSPLNDEGCLSLQLRIATAARRLNPCWSAYDVSTTCPPKWSIMGSFDTSRYLPEGVEAYFNRQKVKEALNVQMDEPWVECAQLAGRSVFAGKTGRDRSAPSAVYALPSLLDRMGNVMLAHGSLDFVLVHEGTLLAIQNMTWRQNRGFQTAPTEPLHVPTYKQAAMFSTTPDGMSVVSEGMTLSEAVVSGTGQFGVAHEERGLTYVGVDLSGHMGPMAAPAAAMRMVEVLLGRTKNLQSEDPFVIERMEKA